MGPPPIAWILGSSFFGFIFPHIFAQDVGGVFLNSHHIIVGFPRSIGKEEDTSSGRKSTCCGVEFDSQGKVADHVSYFWKKMQ